MDNSNTLKQVREFSKVSQLENLKQDSALFSTTDLNVQQTSERMKSNQHFHSYFSKYS